MQAQTAQIGIVSPVVKGEWDSTVTYNKLNIVTHNGVSFIAYGTVTGIVEPGVTVGWESYWMKLSTSPMPMGEWNSTTTYPYLAIVTLDGSSYIANEENYNKNPATSSAWQLIAEKGDDGGFSPTAKVEQTADGAVITITDKSGTTTATVTDGKDGKNGTNGTDGRNGTDGVSPTVATQAITGGTKVTITDKDGAHAFNVMNGTNGTNGKDGTDGTDGTDGITPTIGANGNWYLGNTDTGKPSRGATGATGATGAAGKSAYASAQDGGFTGTEAQFNKGLSVMGQVDGVEDTDALGIDSAVTQNSNNLITSGAVYSSLESKEDKISIPDYWESALTTAVARAKAKQDISGNKCINFVMFSDMHSDADYPTDNNYIKHIGNIAEIASEKLNIPLVAMLGDHVSASISQSVADMEANGVACMDILKNIPDTKLLNILGNHDINGGQGYLTSLSQPVIFNTLLRKESQDFKRVWDSDGRYFYIDNLPQKTRFICLYSNWWDKSILTDNTVSFRYQNSFGFGQQQMDFMVNALSTAMDDWNVVILEHTPVISGYNWRELSLYRGVINAYKHRTTFTDTYTGEYDWENVSVNCDFTNAKGNLVAMFTGHTHQDLIYPEGNASTAVDIPVITITCAANSPYGTNPPIRTLGTSSETALDIVSIDTENLNIYMTRIGTVGSAERSVAYTKYQPAPAITNQIPISLNIADNNVYNNTGYKASTRINSSGADAAITSGSSPAFTTGCIPIKKGDVVRMKNCWIDPDGTPEVYGQNAAGLNIDGYTGDDRTTTYKALGSWAQWTDTGTAKGFVSNFTYDDNGNLNGFTYDNSGGTTVIKYIRFTLGGNPEEAILTVNENIT